MDVRRMNAADCAAVRQRAGYLAGVLYPALIEDIDKTHRLLAEVRLDEKHYARVIGPSGAPQAALIARSGENLWATRRSIGILLWYSDLPGAGSALLRDFRNWAMAQKSVTMAGITIDCDLDNRVELILKRIGFDRLGLGTWVLYPRGVKR